MDNENENSTVAIKSEYSDKEKYEVNLTSLGFLLPEETGKYKYDKAVEKLSDNVIHILHKSLKLFNCANSGDCSFSLRLAACFAVIV